MNRKSLLLVATLAFATSATAIASKPAPDGLVPDEETAIAVAEAILFRIYGKENIRSQRPYKVTLTDGEWYLFGSLPETESADAPVFGGVFRIVISQNDACARSVGHGE